MKNLEIKWAAQLVKEHEAISWKYGVQLSTPVMNISSGKKILGSWDRKNKTISISSHLIKTEIWDIVLEVLKHEMAHQYVSEFYDSKVIHGKYFKRACQKLGVHPAFISSGRDYSKKLQLFKGKLPPDAQKMLNKIEKLVALGQSCNEAEAQSALKKANYLLNKYNLQKLDTKDDDVSEIKYLTVSHRKKRIESIQRGILSVLNNYYHVNCLTSDTYDASNDISYKSIVIVGRKESLKVAEYVYHFLFDTAKILWRNFKKENNAGQREKTSFDMGFISGIDSNHKMSFENSGTKINGKANLPVQTIKEIMLKNKEDNQKEVSRLFPKLRSIKYGKHQVSSKAYKEGYSNGKNTCINKSMTSTNQISGLLQ